MKKGHFFRIPPRSFDLPHSSNIFLIKSFSSSIRTSWYLSQNSLKWQFWFEQSFILKHLKKYTTRAILKTIMIIAYNTRKTLYIHWNISFINPSYLSLVNLLQNFSFFSFCSNSIALSSRNISQTWYIGIAFTANSIISCSPHPVKGLIRLESSSIFFSHSGLSIMCFIL